MSIDITVPHNGWTPRPHQMPLWRYLQEGGKRAIAIWHRRAGKDEVCLHHAAVSAVTRVRRLLARLARVQPGPQSGVGGGQSAHRQAPH